MQSFPKLIAPPFILNDRFEMNAVVVELGARVRCWHNGVLRIYRHWIESPFQGHAPYLISSVLYATH